MKFILQLMIGVLRFVCQHALEFCGYRVLWGEKCVMSQANGSVIKAFQILDLFDDQLLQIGSSDVVSRLGLNTITAHRFLKTLEAAGALVAVSRGHYRLGYKLAELGKRAAGADNLRSALQPVLDQLTKDVGEATLASSFDGESAICIARALPDRPMFVSIQLGSHLEAYASAHGKLWLAHLSETALDAYLERVELKAINEGFVPNRSGLIAELHEIRESGLAFNRGEREPDVYALAVPVLNPSGKMICGLSVFSSKSRMEPLIANDLATKLRAAAKKVQIAFYGTATHAS
ncbi:IclR family transcriptional regulator [Ochrobactrum teleogrylli]